MLNEALLSGGCAVSSISPPDTKYEDRILTVEHNARTAKRGLWGACNAFGVRAPTETPVPTLILPTTTAPQQAISTQAPSPTSRQSLPLVLSHPNAARPFPHRSAANGCTSLAYTHCNANSASDLHSRCQYSNKGVDAHAN